jgi:uncharacterized membrane protein
MPPTDPADDDVNARPMSNSSVDMSVPMPDDLPPSCRCVLQALRYQGPELSRQALLEETGLPERTLYDALETCESRGYIVRARKSGNAREIVAKLSIN